MVESGRKKTAYHIVYLKEGMLQLDTYEKLDNLLKRAKELSSRGQDPFVFYGYSYFNVADLLKATDGTIDYLLDDTYGMEPYDPDQQEDY
jgi:hypothetical protein